MIEAVENVQNFSSKFEQLFDRSDRQVDVDGRHEVDEPISTVSIQSQEIAEKIILLKMRLFTLGKRKFVKEILLFGI
jgi:hypothetical protein